MKRPSAIGGTTIRALFLEALSRKCPVCGGQDVSGFAAAADDAPGQSISVFKCAQCEIAWQWPVSSPNNPSVTQAYHNAYSNDAAALARSELQLDFVSKFKPRPGKLIDIGAGTGAFVRVAAKKGWEAVGVDPSARPFAEAGAQLLRGSPDDFISRGDQFDAVTMFDVIEHVADYVSLMREAARLLKPDGVLVIETGNFQSLSRVRAGRGWWDYQTDHRWYLAPGIVQLQLSELGFERVSLCKRVLRPHWNGIGDSAPSWAQTLRAATRHPRSATQIFRSHSFERDCALRWPKWHHIGIFALAATKRV